MMSWLPSIRWSRGCTFPSAGAPQFRHRQPRCVDQSVGYRRDGCNEPRWMTLALTLGDAEPVVAGSFCKRDCSARRASTGYRWLAVTQPGDRALWLRLQVLGDAQPGASSSRASGSRTGRRDLCIGNRSVTRRQGCRLVQPEIGVHGDNALVERFWRPTPRLSAGAGVCRGWRAAAIDVSDGLLRRSRETDLSQRVASARLSMLKRCRFPLRLCAAVDLDQAVRASPVRWRRL